ncbi:MAG: L-threonylcarbamoyladenylate synthase [Chitinophagales bacterium]|nr:L-threonylcarbamoyladenylate synthase [Chitinophagales bacterium]
MAMYINIHPDNPEPRKINQIATLLREGGLIIYPTDTIYAIGCDIYNKAGIEQIIRIKGIKPKEAHFSIVCHDLSHISEYTNSFSRSVFKLMKSTLPGPFTYILNANKNIPRIYGFKKDTIGIRVPECKIARDLVQALGNPIIATSVHDDEDEMLEYLTDPWEINERFGNRVDAVIDGGMGSLDASTIIDATGEEPLVIREGKGKLNIAAHD